MGRAECLLDPVCRSYTKPLMQSRSHNVFRAWRAATWLVLAGAVWLPASNLSAGPIYTWQAPDGTLHFSDQPKHDGFTLKHDAATRDTATKTEPAWNRARIQAEIDRMAPNLGLDPALIKAVVAVESAFDPVAISHKGAMGLMQLMPATAKRWGVKNPFDPQQNLRGGMRYLKYLMHTFPEQLAWVLAAYHAGEHRVIKYAGIPPFKSTQTYVRRVLGRYQPEVVDAR